MKEVILRFLLSFYFFHLLTFQATVLQAEKKKDELEKIIANRKEELVGTKNNKRNSLIQKKVDDVSNLAQIHWTTMEKLLWRTFLWKDLSNRDNSNLAENFSRLKIIAQSLSTTGSKLEKNKKVRDDLIFALEWIYKNKYNEEKVSQDKQIAPEAIQLFSDILVLIEGALSDAQVMKFSKAILFHSKTLAAENSSELNAFLNSELLLAALIKNSAKVDSIIEKINSHLVYTSSGNGFYEDGSYLSKQVVDISDCINLLSAIANTYSVVSSTKFQLDHSKGKILEKWISKTFIPRIFDNSFIDSEIEKNTSLINNRKSYLEFLGAAIKLSAFQKENAALKGTIKYLIEQLPSNELLQFDYKTLAILQEIISDKNISPIPLQDNLTVHNNYKEVAARRSDFFFGLILFPSDKQLHLTKASDFGKTLIVHKNQGTGITSSEIDSLRVGGATISSSTVKGSKNQSLSKYAYFVGGTETDSLYASVGMEFKDEPSQLKFKKSWFVFDNEVVTLGAGINAKPNDQLESIIDQVKYMPDVFKLYQGYDSAIFSDQIVLQPAQYIFIQNSTDSLGRGYYFPIFQEVNASLNQSKNQKSLTLSILHSKKAIDSYYQYVLLPAISKDGILSYDSNPDVIVLENNDKMQAVREKRLNIIAANFWTKSVSELSVDGSFLITCNSQASIISIERDGTFELSLSDLTQSNEGIIQIELINKPLTEIITKDERVEVIDIEGSKRILFNLKDTKGASIKVKFKTPEPETEN